MRSALILMAVIVLSYGLALGQTEKVLWSFEGPPNDGYGPVSGLVSDSSGNLYGTTNYGGSSVSRSCDGGCGTVFELSPNPDGTWAESVLYSFCTENNGTTCLDGAFPLTGLAFDSTGNLYGTTFAGGADCYLGGLGCGVVFELSPPAHPGNAWSETVLYSFCSNNTIACPDGAWPNSQMVFDAFGNLYGTTILGGTGKNYGGTVFELSPKAGGWTHTILYNFCVNGQSGACPDGTRPWAGVTFDKSGNIYGTTELGGAKNSTGNGTVYELSPGVGGWTHTTLIALKGSLARPLGTVSLDSGGNLYSTTSLDAGGVLEFSLRTHKQVSFLFNGTDGASPAAGLLIDPKAGVAYGTTTGVAYGPGNVFKMAVSGHETVLYNFCQLTRCADGQVPYSSLIEDKTGHLYGTTKYGGIYSATCDGGLGCGVVFEITP